MWRLERVGQAKFVSVSEVEGGLHLGMTLYLLLTIEFLFDVG